MKVQDIEKRFREVQELKERFGENCRYKEDFRESTDIKRFSASIRYKTGV